MKQNIKRIINLVILIILAIVTFLFAKSIPDFLIGKTSDNTQMLGNIETAQTTQEIEKVDDSEVLAMAPGAAFGVSTSNLVKLNIVDGLYFRVIVDGISQLYCAQKGGRLSGQGYTYEEVVSFVNSNDGKKGGEDDCILPNPSKKESIPYYHVSQVRKGNAFESYILTWPAYDDIEWNTWMVYKQEAIWATSLSNNLKAPALSGNQITSQHLVDQASGYADFAKNIESAGGTIAPENKTDEDKVRKQVSKSTNEYIVGPFSIDYVDGDYGVAFGGISDMYIVGQDTKRIEIKSFIINGKEITPRYFQEYKTYIKIDLYAQQYPKPNEEFYVKYVSTSDEEIEKIHVDFKWMETEATLTYYDATMYKGTVTDKHTTHTHHDHSDPDHHHCYSYFICELKAKLSSVNPSYQQLMSAVGKRWIETEALDIPIPPNTKEEVNRNLQIKLAGHVWLDETSGKESLANGTKDSGEDMMPGVEVILHYQNGNIVTKNVNGDKLQNPTVTDNDGYYEFMDLNAQEKYYIEFVYNGQTYQPTKYTDNLSGGYSNATEIVSEREDYNKHYAEINSAPGNYVVRRSLYYNVGSTNTAYIIEKPSTETPYGIKEIYDYLIERAVASKSYSTAYSDTLNKFGNNEATKKKLQFIEDCRISSYTGNDTSRKLYPIYDKFLEGYETRIIKGETYHALYPEHLKIDFGLTLREKFDLALRKDVEKATIEINGKTQTYNYDTRKVTDEADGGAWDISVRLSDAYYNTTYSREVFGSDYQYKASNYDNAAAYGKTKEDELNVYVTYKLTIRNQSQTLLGEVMEIVDYYDEDYEYVNERSYIQIKYGNNAGQYDIKAFGDSRYGTANQTDINGYDAVYVRGLEGTKLSSGQTAYIYLTFKVKKDSINGEDWIRLDEKVESAQAIGVGKENIAEINGFKTYYLNGTEIPNAGTISGNDTPAGLFDRDSVPGNINKEDVPKDGTINYKNFEDDTDKAPNIRLIIYRENGEIVCRTVDGVVWDDQRDEINDSQKTAVGDGIKQNNESAINGATIQLVELMDNGTEYIWKQFSSGQCYINNNDVYTPIINLIGESGNGLVPSDKDIAEGKYIFKSYMPGNYVVRFIYGDTVKTVLPNSSTEVTTALGQSGQNAISYTGQDYKSTTYQEGITAFSTYSNSNTSGSYKYNITASDAKADVSDAKDIMSDDNQNNQYYRQNATLNSREDVIDYSDNDVMNYIAEVLASHEEIPLNSAELSSKLAELMTKTQMTAETGIMNIEVEYDRATTDNQIINNPTSYKIQNLNLGLEERPKAQLAINKEVTNVKLTLADGSTLFDATQKATNVLWRDHKAYVFNYSANKLTGDPMEQIRENNTYDVLYGLVQMSMDSELMHGATIKISYKITVTNVGEVDYKDNEFYYTGNVSNKNTVVKTIANQVVDYVANNLQFYAVDNSSWQVISQDELLNGPVNMTLANQTAKYNTVITTSANSNIAKTQLVPEIYGSGTSSVSDDLILTQLITSENETDDLTYRNILEIVRTSNDVGRRNAYSVVGNQNPTADVTEVDSDVSEVVKILPPYGNGGINYIIATITILASAILVSGIIFIKKKILK